MGTSTPFDFSRTRFSIIPLRSIAGNCKCVAVATLLSLQQTKLSLEVLCLFQMRLSQNLCSESACKASPCRLCITGRNIGKGGYCLQLRSLANHMVGTNLIDLYSTKLVTQAFLRSVMFVSVIQLVEVLVGMNPLLLPGTSCMKWLLLIFLHLMLRMQRVRVCQGHSSELWVGLHLNVS